MGKTSIEWTDESVNPIRARAAGSTATKGGYASGVGHYCEKISPGCRNCYSSATQPRFGLPVFQEQRGAGIETFLDPSKLIDVLTRKKPTKFFWCDMTDMFGRWVPDGVIAACFGVMAATPWHTHQVLTKRADRMRDWFSFRWSGRFIGLAELAGFAADAIGRRVPYGTTWPLPNAWIGVSVEDQERADDRIPKLLDTPAAVRFLSVEPLLGHVALHPGALGGVGDLAETFGNPLIHQVIVGGESGSGAREVKPEWVRSLRDTVTDSGAAFFFKQWGGARKKLAGRELDGRTWDEFPIPRKF